MQHTFVIGEIEYEAWLSRNDAGYVLHIGDKAVPVAVANGEGGWQVLRLGADTLRVLIAPDGDFVHIHLDGTAFTEETEQLPCERSGHILLSHMCAIGIDYQSHIDTIIDDEQHAVSVG